MCKQAANFRVKLNDTILYFKDFQVKAQICQVVASRYKCLLEIHDRDFLAEIFAFVLH